jgi:hypothetical protein
LAVRGRPTSISWVEKDLAVELGADGPLRIFRELAVVVQERGE